MQTDLAPLQEAIASHQPRLEALRAEMGRAIVGQQNLIERLLVGLLANGHVLLEGVPGLAKTATVNALAQCLHLKFARVQFTPDLLPGDLVGNLVFNPRDNTYHTRKGPIFANLVLADEINRAPAKVQSALLEAMQERKVTIGNQNYRLPAPFLVIATQNPVEQAGTFELPEAQLDRFILLHRLDYLTRDEEKEVLRRNMALGVKRDGAGAIARTEFDVIEDEPVGTIEDLARAMLEHAGHGVNLDEEIDGKVEL